MIDETTGRTGAEEESARPIAAPPGGDRTDPEELFHPGALTRPDAALLKYYLAVSSLTLVFFPFVFLPLWFKYRTLRYRFDEKGVSMSWGVLFRREVHLTYRRIQDIHVSRDLLHRWLGLATLKLQTASGKAGAEMTIEGIRRPERLRDFLYGRMRGAQDTEGDGQASLPDGVEDEVLVLLHEIRDELRRLGSPGPRAGTDA